MNDSNANILVVDDDDGGRYLKAHVLRKHGYRVAEASTGMAAIELCSALAPDLVLLDVMLPDVDGVEISRRMKAAHPGIAVLQTSAAVTSSHDRALALEGGADGFLVEPIEPEELLATAQALLRMRGAEQALRRMNESLELLVAERTRELTEANRQLEIESAERRKTEEVLWHTQKLEAVGQLTGGIAHDFNNLLAVIVGSVEMIRLAFDAGGDLPRAKILRLLNASETATSRATKLTQQLLAFARRSTFTLDIVSLDEVLVACEPFLRRALGETNVLDLTFERDLWPSRIDASQFEAAILNLVVNARDAMPLGGKLEIATGNVVIDAIEARRSPDLTAGAYVMVRVTDTGIGMDPDVAMHAFEPFFTTKEVGKGTGLGLSQVYGFIKQSGGHVVIDSIPGTGTTFRLYLPRCDAVRQVSDGDTGMPSATPTGHETVLVVEDNAEVLELAVATISDLGYRVLTAADGPSALGIVQGCEAIDLLFSDVVMPGGMNGFELINQARAIRIGLKALVTSGYANMHRPGSDRPDVPLLLKPYRRGDLAQCIRMALDRA
ncbi:MAG TPA: response regulator [Acetobacteraceae bacterium]|nr:response regulator [Acetobacteraceae bacterium]